MKKSDIRNIASALENLPLKECEDREMKIGLIQDRINLKRIATEINSDIDALRHEIVGDKQDKVNEYFAALQADDMESVKKLLPEIKDVVSDFNRASIQMLSQDVSVDIPFFVDEGALVTFIVDKCPSLIDSIDAFIPIIK